MAGLYRINKPLSGLLVSRLIMSLAERLSYFHIVLLSHLPSQFCFSAKCSFFGQSLSRGHYQPTYQPPEEVYLLNIISSHVKISMISVISSLSLKLYLNLLVHHRNIFGSSSKVFGNLRQSSDIFGNFRKFRENVRERSSGLRNNFGKSSEIFGKWSEIFGKSSKTPSSVCLYNKKNITR